MEKVLLITGASSDVGVELARRVLKDYSTVYLHYRTMNNELQHLIEYAPNGVKVIPVQADFMDADSVQRMVEQIKETGVLPNRIIHLPFPKAYNKQFHKDKWENYEMGWKISVQSIVLILQALLPSMAKQKYGRIIFMLTKYTVDMPPKFQSSYVTVKYALLGLMKSLAVEYAEKGITVNGVSPDMMETKFLSEIPEMIIENNRNNSPIGKNITIDEILPVFEYMLSDAGASMTGQNIAITGGL